MMIVLSDYVYYMNLREFLAYRSVCPMCNNELKIHGSKSDNFKVTLVDTGLETKTAGRLQQIQKFIGDEDFMLTYGDGVCDVNIENLVQFHKQNNKIATVTAIRMDARFGGMDLDKNGDVLSFKEKAKDEGKWINGGFFVLKPTVFNYLQGNLNDMMWEDAPLEKLTNDNELAAYQHNGFWKCMDALRDKIELEELWKSNSAKWKQWN